MLFIFCGRNIADGLQDAPVVESIDPCEGNKFASLEGFPGTPVDEFALIEAVDGLGECVVVRIVDAAERWLDAGFGQAFSVFDRDTLAARRCDG